MADVLSSDEDISVETMNGNMSSQVIERSCIEIEMFPETHADVLSSDEDISEEPMNGNMSSQVIEKSGIEVKMVPGTHADVLSSDEDISEELMKGNKISQYIGHQTESTITELSQKNIQRILEIQSSENPPRYEDIFPDNKEKLPSTNQIELSGSSSVAMNELASIRRKAFEISGKEMFPETHLKSVLNPDLEKKFLKAAVDVLSQEQGNESYYHTKNDFSFETEKHKLFNNVKGDRRIQGIEQNLERLQQTTIKTHLSLLDQRLHRIEQNLQSQSSPSNRSETEENISQRVVQNLVRNEQFKQMLQRQDSAARSLDITEAYPYPDSVLSKCRKCRCYKCRCECHFFKQNDVWRREEDLEVQRRSRQMQSRYRENGQETPRHTTLFSETGQDGQCDFYNSFCDTSDMYDYDSGLDSRLQTPVGAASGRKLPDLEELESENTSYQIHGASGGAPGQPPDDDPSSDNDSGDDKKVEESGINRGKYRTNTKWVIDPEAWKSCMENDFENKANELLNEGKLPDQTLLNETCFRHKRINKIVQKICKCICSFIKEKSETFLNVWAAYQYKKGKTNYGNEIVFVVLTDGNDGVDISEFNTYKRCVHAITTEEENNDVLVKERENRLKSQDLKYLENCLKENAAGQMTKHSNLTRVTISWFTSIGYGTEQYTLQKQPCIALYVQIKGYIPLDEEPFSEQIEEYPVDVREGVFIPCGGGPNDFHRNVKMGCAIRGPMYGNQIYAGTLGAFVKLENEGHILALTSAHVLFSGERLKAVLEKGYVSFENKNEIVFQPVSNEESTPFGRVICALYTEGGNGVAGMEVAAIKVNEDRSPITGTFPEDPTYLDRGFGPESPLEFFTGSCCDSSRLSDLRLVYKYGSESKLTEGLCRVHGASVRTNILRDNILEFPLTLHNQIEIESTQSSVFAEQGDSGALVFTKDENELLAVGIFEGQSNGVFVATPMSRILEELTRVRKKECRLKTFQSCIPRPENISLTRNKVSIIVNEIVERHLTVQKRIIDQKFTSHSAEISEIKKNVGEIRVQSEKQREEFKEENKELKELIRKQNDEQKDHVTAAIQFLLAQLKGTDSSPKT